MRDSVKVRDWPYAGDLVWVLDGARTMLGIILEVDGSIYHATHRDFRYILLVEGSIRKYNGWRLELITEEL